MEKILNLRKQFNNLMKIIYVDPDEKFIDLEDGTVMSMQNISFSIDMAFYLLMSQYFKKIKIKFGGELKDLRTSLFLILPSRMGKGQIIKGVEEVGKNLGLKIKRVSYINQASLIGSLNEKIIEINLKKGLKEGDKGYKTPIIYGALHNADILIFPEAKKLVKGSNEAETEFILSTLQEALDYPGLINKELKYSDFPITYESTVSILATTYWIVDIALLLIEQGFFQRVPTYKAEYDLDTIKGLRAKIIEMYRSKNTRKSFKEESKQFATLILNINNEEKILEFSNDAVNRLHEFNLVFFERLTKLSGKQLEILKSFSQTIIEMIVRISGINCCLRQDRIISLGDINSSIVIFNTFLTVIVEQLVVDDSKKETKTDESKTNVIRYYKKYLIENMKNPTKTELLNYCKAKEMPFNRTLNLLTLMIKENYFNYIDEKGRQVLRLNED